MNACRRHSKAVTSVVSILCLFWLMIIVVNTAGEPQYMKSSRPLGCNCHGDASSDASVTITGPDSLRVNETGNFMVTIEGGPLIAAGVTIVAEDGDLNTINSDLKKSGGELSHTDPKTPHANAVTFEFEFTAPATEGQVALSADGMSTDLDGSVSGDKWNSAIDKSITILAPTDLKSGQNTVPEGFTLEQNYPNPFNSGTKIRYTIKNAGFVLLEVFTVSGRKVSTLVKSDHPVGSYSINLNELNLESGTYMYRLTINGKTQCRRMALVK